jgi:hypothetical protein
VGEAQLIARVSTDRVDRVVLVLVLGDVLLVLDATQVDTFVLVCTGDGFVVAVFVLFAVQTLQGVVEAVLLERLQVAELHATDVTGEELVGWHSGSLNLVGCLGGVGRTVFAAVVPVPKFENVREQLQKIEVMLKK